MKEGLINALKKERDMFIQRGLNIKDHELAITYLETGEKPSNYGNFDLLTACIEDFDCICSDYDVKS